LNGYEPIRTDRSGFAPRDTKGATAIRAVAPFISRMVQVDSAGPCTYAERIRFYLLLSARIRSSRNRLFPFLSPNCRTETSRTSYPCASEY
jgi:hypothetical protein